MNLIVYDDKVIKAGEKLKKHYEELDNTIWKYRDIIEYVLDNGIKLGEIHDSLKEFWNQVNMNSSVDCTSADAQGGKYKTYCDNYISWLDEADKDLY